MWLKAPRTAGTAPKGAERSPQAGWATPPRWKDAVAIWLGLYPLLQLATLVLIPRLDALPAPLRTFLISTLLVGLMTYIVTPAVRHLLHRWLH